MCDTVEWLRIESCIATDKCATVIEQGQVDSFETHFATGVSFFSGDQSLKQNLCRFATHSNAIVERTKIENNQRSHPQDSLFDDKDREAPEVGHPGLPDNI